MDHVQAHWQSYLSVPHQHPFHHQSLFFRDIQRRDVVDSDSTTFSPELINLSKRAQSVVDANTVSRMSKFMQYSAASVSFVVVRLHVSTAMVETQGCSPLSKSYVYLNSHLYCVVYRARGSDFDSVSVSGEWECGVVCEGDTKDTVIQTVFLQTRGKNTAGIVAIQPSSKTIVVAFRGAVEFSDWIINIRFKKRSAPWLNDGVVSTNRKRVPFPNNLEIHSGFQSAYLDIRSLMMARYQDCPKKVPWI
ncbi:hypothetical protein BASA83_011031 [Batrachochytrium salamandrivorans]|nr:hypothetical protein BASA83_011031 [Batrachochytrium salamandrivorans]